MWVGARCTLDARHTSKGSAVCFSEPIATLYSREGRLFEVYQTQGRARLYIPEVPAWELHANAVRRAQAPAQDARQHEPG
jgi:hypothetical protein